MKTSPTFILSLGVLLFGSAFAQIHSPAAEWQPMKIDQAIEPTFPFRLLNQGVTSGVAEVVISVDSAGQLGEWLVVRYSKPEFAEAAVTAIKLWKFEPARLRGEPVGTTSELVFQFEARGVVVSSATVNEALEARLNRMRSDRDTYQPCSADRLDRVPVPTVTVVPQYPKALAAKGVKGRVVVEYYIDETGSVRVPCVSAEEDAILGALTVAAVSQWKFEPPTSHGKAVLVKASQVFDFKGDGS